LQKKIENYIAYHHLRANDKLPSERELVELWGVNRMTLRSAIEKLVDNGVLYKITGKGTYVAPKKIVRNLGVCRSFTESLNELNVSFETEVLSIRKLEANKHLSKVFSVFLGTDILEIKRKRIVEDMPFSIETSYLPYELCKGIEEFNYQIKSLYALLNKHYNIQLVSQRQNIHIAEISDENQKVLEVNKGADVFFFIKSTARDCEGKVIEYSTEWIRSDRCIITSVSREK
jgi:GntR family transcriptional regulator